MKMVNARCPACDSRTLGIELRLKAAQIGSFSLAGVQMKFPVSEVPYLVCTTCGSHVEGTIEPGGTHAVFKPEGMIDSCKTCQHGGQCCLCGRTLSWLGMSWHTHHDGYGVALHTRLRKEWSLRLVQALADRVNNL